MRVNRQIRARTVRVIGPEGDQLGVVSIMEALKMAEEQGLDLVEVVPNSTPPVCKIIDYGKFRYDQSKREKESKRAQHQIKVKEVKVKPNIDEHDFQTKLRRARQFAEKGYKVKVTCMFRGRQMAHPDVGMAVVKRMCDELSDVVQPESPPKMLGRSLTTVLAPVTAKGRKKQGVNHAKDENAQGPQKALQTNGNGQDQA